MGECMSEIVDAAVTALNRRLDGSGLDGAVRFVIEDEGAVMIDGDGARADAGDGRRRLHPDRQRRDLPGSPRRRSRPDRRLHERPAARRRQHGPRHEARDAAVLSPRDPLPPPELGAPFFADVADAPAGAEAFHITTADGVRLRAVAWRGGTRGTAVIFPGRTEFAEKYGRVVAALDERGLSALVVDWRGQGLSDRHPRNPLLGHVQDFRDYQQDVAALLALEAALDLPGPRYLVAHSMGGCIGLRTLLERTEFCGAILSAPMWRLQMRAATRELTSKMTRLANLTGFGARLMPGTRPGPTAHEGFAENALTSDEATFAWCVRQIAAHPELALGGPSMQWTYAALEEMARLHVAPLPRIPDAGDAGRRGNGGVEPRDPQPGGADGGGRASRASRRAARIFMEAPAVRAEVWRAVDRFLESVPARRGPPDPRAPA